MRYVDEFRDGDLARGMAAAIARSAGERPIRLMEFCGGHTHAIYRFGLPALLPETVELVHGPGCPVCVLPVARLDLALSLAATPGVILCSYGDMLRVPGSGGRTLLKARAAGADVRMVYSISEALQIARERPDAEVVFFAIGFETTTPPTAVALLQAEAEGLGNFTVLCNHVLTPPALASILAPSGARPPARLDGFIGPAHVSTVIGSRPFEAFAAGHGKPVVIAGFEPLDLLQAIAMLVEQVRRGEARVENQYRRAVSREGNTKAQRMVELCFEPRDSFAWRGLGELPRSGLQIRERFAAFDAERRFDLVEGDGREHPGCACGAVLRGQLRPEACRLFAGECTPETPRGACMVSSEGACAAHYAYGRHRAARGGAAA